jgi:hypothetical protein
MANDPWVASLFRHMRQEGHVIYLANFISKASLPIIAGKPQEDVGDF